jgi:hypothetical protein
MNPTISFIANSQLRGDGITPATMDFYKGQKYPWLSTLLPVLSDANCSWEVLDWKDPFICWEEKQVLVLGPVWGYFEEHELFIEWVSMLNHKGVVLHNSTDFILWNINKTYLLDIESCGISIPYTKIIEPENTESWETVAKQFMMESAGREFILKGLVDAAASTFTKVNCESLELFAKQFEEVKSTSEGVILQEYLPEVSQCGEFSFVFFDGQLGHTFIKVPKHNEDRVQVFFGGKSFHIKGDNFQECIDQIKDSFRPNFQLSVLNIISAHEQVVVYIEKLRALFDAKNIPFPLYLRLDAVLSKNRLLVMELEGIEPYMELSEAMRANKDCKTVALYVEAILRLQKTIPKIHTRSVDVLYPYI